MKVFQYVFWVHCGLAIVSSICPHAVSASLLKSRSSTLVTPTKLVDGRPTPLPLNDMPMLSDGFLTAQIQPDMTLENRNSVLQPNAAATNILIEGGVDRGANLFHSFQEFNVNSGQQVFFTNPNGIENIFTRVTGENASNIDGTLGINGSANLFLLNPNGIIFGPEASLRIGGRLIASVGESFPFVDGSEFSAVSVSSSSLLSMSAPLGVQYNLPTGQGETLSQQESTDSLLITSPNTLLISEDLNNVEDEINISPTFLENMLRDSSVVLATSSNLLAEGDITHFGDNSLSLGASNIIIEARISQEGSGSLLLQTPQSPDNEISIQSGELFTFNDDDALGSQSGDISLITGVLSIDDGRVISLNAPLGASGTINISASESVLLSNNSQVNTNIRARMDANNTIDSVTGELSISTNSLQLLDGSTLGTGTKGKGNAGRIVINASDITLDGRDVDDRNNPSGIFSGVEANAEGDGGEIVINTNTLRVLGNARVTTDSFSRGDSGKIRIFANEHIKVSDGGLITSQVVNQIFIDILGDDILGNDRNIIGSEGVGTSNGIEIVAGNLDVLDGGLISTSTLAQGDGGPIDIDIEETVTVRDIGSRITSSVGGAATGNSGKIKISAGDLNILDGAIVNADTFGQGDSGLIDVSANTILISNLGLLENVGDYNIATGISSGVLNPVDQDQLARGNSTGILINTDYLEILGGAGISSRTLGQGDAGRIEINAQRGINLGGSGSGNRSTGIATISSNVGDQEARDNVSGIGGDIIIDTGFLEITDSARIIASTFSDGDSGEVDITANLITINDLDELGIDNIPLLQAGIYNRVEGYLRSNGEIVLDEQGNPRGEPAMGDSGGITIVASSLNLLNDARITTTTGGDGISGDIVITANTIDLSNSELSAESFSNRRAGSIVISSADQIKLGQGSEIETDATAVGGGDIIFKDIGVLLLRNGSRITAESGSPQESGNGGNISVFDTDFIVTVPNENNDILANAFRGRGGNISLTAERILGFIPRFDLTPDQIINLPNNASSDISASSQFGQQGEVTITNLAIDPTQGLTDLPLLSPPAQVQRGCSADAVGTSSFTVTGHGGLPPSPTDVLGRNLLLTDLGPENSISDTSSALQTHTLHSTPGTPLIEAQGLVKSADGRSFFVAQAYMSGANSSEQQIIQCDGTISANL